MSMTVWKFPPRDPLQQWAQAAYDPDSPEARASADRALQAQRTERADVLYELYGEDSDAFDKTFLTYFWEDPGILSALKAKVVCNALLRELLQIEES